MWQHNRQHHCCQNYNPIWGTFKHSTNLRRNKPLLWICSRHTNRWFEHEVWQCEICPTDPNCWTKLKMQLMQHSYPQFLLVMSHEFMSLAQKQRQSSQWKTSLSLAPKKAWMSRSLVKAMLIAFFVMEGMIHIKFVPRGCTINAVYYIEVLKRLREPVRQKKTEKWRNGWLLHYNNVPSHMNLLIVAEKVKQLCMCGRRVLWRQLVTNHINVHNSINIYSFIELLITLCI